MQELNELFRKMLGIQSDDEILSQNQLKIEKLAKQLKDELLQQGVSSSQLVQSSLGSNKSQKRTSSAQIDSKNKYQANNHFTETLKNIKIKKKITLPESIEINPSLVEVNITNTMYSKIKIREKSCVEQRVEKQYAKDSLPVKKYKIKDFDAYLEGVMTSISNQDSQCEQDAYSRSIEFGGKMMSQIEVYSQQ